MLPFYYRLMRYAPSVGTPSVLETRPVQRISGRPFGEEAFFPPEKRAPEFRPAQEPPALTASSSEFHKEAGGAGPGPQEAPPFHLSKIWENPAKGLEKLPHRILIATENAAEAPAWVLSARELASSFRGQWEEVHVDTAAQSAVKGILQRSREKGSSLIVVGTHGRHGMERVKEGSVAEGVVKEAACEVLVMKDAVNWSRIERILIPVEASPTDYREIAAGIRLAKHFGAEIDLLHAHSTSEIPQESFRRWAAWMKQARWTEVEVRDVKSPLGVAEGIVDFAAKNATGLILMGTHRDAIENQSLPTSVCLEILRKASCPVWAIHPYEA
ncbi:MAG: universal stress protein [bacterium]